MRGGLIALMMLLVSLVPVQPANTRADWNENAGLWVVGDEEFQAKVNQAILHIGYAQWITYVRQHIIEIKQWNGDEYAHVGIVIIEPQNCDEHNVCKGTFLIRRDVGTVEWLAMAIVHEAAHIAIRNNEQRPIKWEDECMADYITQAFAITAGLHWDVRRCN